MNLPKRGAQGAGFTLIELLAVVAILALLVGVTAPNLGAVRARWLHNQSKQLAAFVELARQRAMMTGIPHRVLRDLTEGAYRLEWLRGEEQEDDIATGPPVYDLRGSTPLPLSAPPSRELSYGPIPGNRGHFHFLSSEIHFAGLETAEGWLDRGEVAVRFDEDGTSEHSEIVLENERGERTWLEIRPIADAVRILDVGS